MEWAGVICGWIVLVLALLFGVFWVFVERPAVARAKEARQEVLATGRRLLCWVVLAESELSIPGLKRPTFPFAMVVFTFENFGSELPLLLSRVAERIRGYGKVEPISDADEDLATSMRAKSCGGNETPVAVPLNLTEGITMYRARVDVPFELLSKGYLDRPYLYAAVVENDLSKRVYMVPYPSEPGSELEYRDGPTFTYWLDRRAAEPSDAPSDLNNT